jgi:hypothetical protein
MLRQSGTTLAGRYPHFAALLLTVVVTPACTGTKNWLQGRKTADAEPVVLGAPETDQYINEMYRLVGGDPATQAEIYADSRAAARLTPDPSTRLRLALVLATPGHSESNTDKAQDLLRELLSQQELMSPGEISLATIYLEQVEDRIMLAAETNRLRSENNRAASTEDAAIAQRVATVESENRRLRQSLAEAENKLEAITSIEKSIREQ